MLFNVPQYTNVEDKVAGPLTIKQLGWLFGMTGVLIFLHSILDEIPFWIAAIPITGLFAAFTFYRPNGQPLFNYVLYGITFLFRPKVYVWKREARSEKMSKRKIQDPKTSHIQTQLEAQTITSLAKTLDSDGEFYDDIFDELVKRG